MLYNAFKMALINSNKAVIEKKGPLKLNQMSA